MLKNYILTFSLIFSAAFLNAQTTLTYNTDNIVTGTNSVGCPGGDNDWARNFVFTDFSVDESNDFEIVSGEFGVQTNDNTGLTVTVSVYSSDTSFPASFDIANLLGTQDVSVPDTALETVISFNFDTPIIVPAGTTAIVYAVTTPLGNNFFIGGTLGETADGFLRSANCAVADYVTASSIGFPDAHFYMTLTGNTILSIDDASLAGKGYKVFPNPTEAIFNIALSTNNELINARIVNMLGEVVFDNLKTTSIDISKLPTGIYFLNLETALGSATERIVKK